MTKPKKPAPPPPQTVREAVTQAYRDAGHKNSTTKGKKR